jgi:hypothetical protein
MLPESSQVSLAEEQGTWDDFAFLMEHKVDKRNQLP